MQPAASAENKRILITGDAMSLMLRQLPVCPHLQ
jgi:hypothetical protein